MTGYREALIADARDWCETQDKESKARQLVEIITDALAKDGEALDRIATRVTDDDYDNPSSALESIGDAVESTGRRIPNGDDDA